MMRKAQNLSLKFDRSCRESNPDLPIIENEVDASVGSSVQLRVFSPVSTKVICKVEWINKKSADYRFHGSKT